MVKVGDMVFVSCLLNRKIHQTICEVVDISADSDFITIKRVRSAGGALITKYKDGILTLDDTMIHVHKGYVSVIPYERDYSQLIDLALATNDREWFEELVGREQHAE